MLQGMSDRMREQQDAAEIERLEGKLVIARSGLRWAMLGLEAHGYMAEAGKAETALRQSDPSTSAEEG